MKKLVLNCFLLLIGQLNAFGSTAFQFDDVNSLTLLNPSLTLKANFYFGDQDETALPIAETEFYLLDESLVTILKESGFKPEFVDRKRHKSKLTDKDYLTATAAAFSSEDDESALIALLIKAGISKHKLFTLKTNRSGQANIKELGRGRYYVFGVGKMRDETFVWHFAVDVKSCANRIKIDQYNAEIVFPAED